jgi:hypothetical protein
MRGISWLAAGILALASTGTTRSAQAQEMPIVAVELPQELAAVLRAYEAGWTARDADALAALFTADGFILRPNLPPVRGREAIRKSYTGVGGPLVLRGYAHAVSDTIGYIIGGFGVAEDGPDVGKFILTLRRESGRWMITADIDNGNR